MTFMVHNVADHDNVIGISYNRAIEMLSQPGGAVSGSVCERWRYCNIQSFKFRVCCYRREGIGDLQPFLKHLSMIALLCSDLLQN